MKSSSYPDSHSLTESLEQEHRASLQAFEARLRSAQKSWEDCSVAFKTPVAMRRTESYSTVPRACFLNQGTTATNFERLFVREKERSQQFYEMLKQKEEHCHRFHVEQDDPRQVAKVARQLAKTTEQLELTNAKLSRVQAELRTAKAQAVPKIVNEPFVLPQPTQRFEPSHAELCRLNAEYAHLVQVTTAKCETLKEELYKWQQQAAQRPDVDAEFLFSAKGTLLGKVAVFRNKLDERLDYVEARLASLQSLFSQKKAQARGELASQHSEIERLRKSIKQLKLSEQSREEEFAQITQQLKSDKAELASQQEALKAQLQTQKTNAHTRTEALQQHLSEMHTKNQRLEEEVLASQESVLRMQQQLKAAEKQSATLQQKLEAAEHEYSAQERTLHETLQANSTLQIALAESSHSVKQLNNQLADLQFTANLLEEKGTEAAKQALAKEEHINYINSYFQEEVTTLREELASAKLSEESTQSALDHLVQHFEALKAQQTVANGRIAELEKENSELKSKPKPRSESPTKLLEAAHTRSEQYKQLLMEKQLEVERLQASQRDYAVAVTQLEERLGEFMSIAPAQLRIHSLASVGVRSQGIRAREEWLTMEERLRSQAKMIEAIHFTRTDREHEVNELIQTKLALTTELEECRDEKRALRAELTQLQEAIAAVSV